MRPEKTKYWPGTKQIKFIYSEKTIKFCEIFNLFLTVCAAVKSKVKILQNFVANSEYKNFTVNFWQKVDFLISNAC